MWAKLIVGLKKILYLFDINASSIHMKQMMRFDMVIFLCSTINYSNRSEKYRNTPYACIFPCSLIKLFFICLQI